MSKPIASPQQPTAEAPSIDTQSVDTRSVHKQSEAHRAGAWRRLLPILLIVGAAWAGVAWLDRWEDQQTLPSGEAPPLAITAFDGSPIKLADHRGQGVVVNFWASWCEPCRVEAPIFQEAWRSEQARARAIGQNPDQEPEIVFIGVAILDTPAASQAFIEEYDITYPNGPDTDARWDRRFGVNGVPTTFFIGPDGAIESVALGPITSTRALARHLEAIRPAAAPAD